jgi:hypothetical protein
MLLIMFLAFNSHIPHTMCKVNQQYSILLEKRFHATGSVNDEKYLVSSGDSEETFIKVLRKFP